MNKYSSVAKLYGYFLMAVLAICLVFAGSAPAMAEPVPLSVYGRLPGFERAAISPSGDHVAILGTLDGERQVLVLDAAGKLVSKVPVGPVKVRSVDWAGDSAVLIYFSKTTALSVDFTADRAELFSTIVMPMDGSNLWMVFAGDRAITGGVQGFYGLVQRDGRWFGYFSAITMDRTVLVNEYRFASGNPDLYEVDLASHKVRLVARRPDGEDLNRRWLLDETGAIAATLDYNRKSGGWRIYVRGGKELASGTNLDGQIGLVGFTPDGASLIYTVRDAKAQHDDWFTVPLAGGERQPYLTDVAFQSSLMDAGHHMIGYVNDLAEGKAHLFNPRHQRTYAAIQKAFPGERVTLADFNQAFSRLIVTTEGSGDPIGWWQVDIPTGDAKPLGRSYVVPSEEVAPFQMVSYKAADGLAMEGVLTLPPGRPAKNLPAIMLPHGGPSSHDSPGFDWIAQAFASRGYAVFQPNFRGSDGYGADFELAGHGEWGRKMQSDISDGLGELVRQGVVDPKRVCIVGASYGGYAALAGVTLQQGIYRCAVAVAGISDLGRMVNGDITESGDDPLIVRVLHDEVGRGRDLNAVSPLRFVDRVSVPVMLIHGKDDTVVKFAQSSTMVTALGKAGKQVEFVTLPGEDHWLSSSDTRQKMLESAVGFVAKNNPP
jgi:dipeptidyl aminopeptidase/acylaminoacyl peptidase